MVEQIIKSLATFTGLQDGQQNAIAMKFSQDTMDGMFQRVYREAASDGLWAIGEVDRSVMFGYQMEDDWFTCLYYCQWAR